MTKSAYERERDQRIDRNAKFLASLGLDNGLVKAKAKAKKPKARKRARPSTAPMRRSSRQTASPTAALRGGRDEGMSAEEIAAEIAAERAAAERSAAANLDPAMHRARNRNARLSDEQAAALRKIDDGGPLSDAERAAAAAARAALAAGVGISGREGGHLYWVAARALLRKHGVRRPAWIDEVRTLARARAASLRG